jgi:hypothetical protein
VGGHNSPGAFMRPSPSEEKGHCSQLSTSTCLVPTKNPVINFINVVFSPGCTSVSATITLFFLFCFVLVWFSWQYWGLNSGVLLGKHYHLSHTLDLGFVFFFLA